jgi:hypothetical protein
VPGDVQAGVVFYVDKQLAAPEGRIGHRVCRLL